MKINKDDIKPKVKGQSDFFSWQLFRWIRKNPTAFRIYKGTWNSIDGLNADNTALYIGYERENGGWIIARNLRNLCCVNQDLQSYSYGGCHDTANWIDVTQEFWSDYMKKGVCAIHGDNAHDWTNCESRRVCNHCGKVQESTIIMVPKIVWQDSEVAK